MAEVQEIAEGIYRISTFIPEANLAFNQFLIDDEKPLLFHTGQRMLFPDTLAGVKNVIDPARLRYISWSHLEADECGALNDFLAVAPSAEPVHGEIGKMLSIDDFSSRPTTPMSDGDVLDLGKHKLRFLITPQVPHSWDAILLFDETTATLLASDLFTQSGERRATTESDMVDLTVHTHAMFPRLHPDRRPHVACLRPPGGAGSAHARVHARPVVHRRRRRRTSRPADGAGRRGNRRARRAGSGAGIDLLSGRGGIGGPIPAFHPR